jgi:hypothetical protein
MFGHLMKSLGSAQQDLQKQAERDSKRRTVEARIQERQRQQDEELAQQRKEQWRRGNARSRSRSYSRSPIRNRPQRRLSSDLAPRPLVSHGDYLDIVSITEAERHAPRTPELVGKLRTYQDQAQYLKTQTQPVLLYLPHTLLPDQQIIIDGQIRDAEDLLADL